MTVFLFTMLILISQPFFFPEETARTEQFLLHHPELRFHLRKPSATEQACEEFLCQLPETLHSRIVVHQHFGLYEKLGLHGIHLNEQLRQQQGSVDISAVSTSFHTTQDVLTAGNTYSYFFCSPVFDSISKKNYPANPDWDINGFPEVIRQKAVALGGISPETIAETKNKGFRHAAVIGAVWQSAQPGEVLRELMDHFA